MSCPLFYNDPFFHETKQLMNSFLAQTDRGHAWMSLTRVCEFFTVIGLGFYTMN